MKPMEEKGISENMRREVSRDEMGDFERQFRNPENGNRLKKDLTVKEVMEKAGMGKIEWLDIPDQIRSWIMTHGGKTYGVSARPWEKNLGQMIFGNKAENIYYMLQKSGKNFAWSRFWVNERGTIRCEAINRHSGLSEVIGTVAFHEFGEPIRSRTEVAEETRKKAKKNLRPWENK